MDSLSKALTAMEDGLLIDPQNVSARRYLAQMYLKAKFTLDGDFHDRRGTSI